MRFRRATAIFAIFALASAFTAVADSPAYAKNDKAGGPPGGHDVVKGQGKGGKGGKPEHAGKPGKADKSDRERDEYREREEYRHRDEARDRDDYRDRRRDYRDEDVIEELRRYRHDRGDRTPDYLRNPQGLPPGIAKNLQRGKPLPPGIAKKVDDDDLLRRLPRSYDRSEWYAAGDRLVEYDPVNEAIINVIDQTLYGRR